MRFRGQREPFDGLRNCEGDRYAEGNVPIFPAQERISASQGDEIERLLSPEIRLSQSKTAPAQRGVPVDLRPCVAAGALQLPQAQLCA